MGIPYYVASILRQHKHIQKDTGNAPLECEILGMDFNAFIHQYLKPENPVGSVVLALRDFLCNTVRAKKIYIAFDGLVPYAKIVQQRYRRMKNPEGESKFDKHQISPGTQYMLDLAEAIEFAFPNVIVSGTLEPGEGEHKVFRWLRTIEDRKDIVIYGLDADLVLISVAQSHLGTIRLLRENRDGGYSTFDINALKAVLPVAADLWVQFCVFAFGNDFMPTVAMFSLREDGYGRGMYYIKKKDFQLAAMDEMADDELKMLMKRAKDTDRHIVSTDGHAVETRVGIHLLDGVVQWEPVVHAFWKTYEWTMLYFTTSEVPDWCWYYPYAEAPLMQTLNEYEPGRDFVWEYPSPPFTIEDQLRFILPTASLKMDASFEDELYEEGIDSRHRWMKTFAWESDPLISLPWNPASELTHVVWVPIES